MKFATRVEAGVRLAERLSSFSADDAVVCGVPRGGAVVAGEAAVRAELPYECLVICRIGMPCFPDVTLGAIDEDGDVLFDPATELTRFEVGRIGDSILHHMEAKITMCRAGRDPVDYTGKTAIVVEDYVADPLVARKALGLLRKRGASRVVLAAPAITKDIADELAADFDEVIALETPDLIRNPGEVYREAEEPSDAEISEHLQAAWGRTGQ